MPVLSISNQKGGAGKTSLTHNVGCVLAEEFKKKILFVDVDGQANLTTALGFDPDDLEKTVAEMVTDKDAKAKQYILPTNHPNISLIPSSQRAFSAEKKLSDRHGREFVLSDLLEPVKNDYDLILLDTPPNLGLLTLNALIATNALILVYTASEFALDGLSQILSTVEEIQANKRLNVNHLKILGAVHNRYKTATKHVNEKVEADLQGLSEIPKYFPAISDSTEVEKAQFAHQPMIAYAPKHKVTRQFVAFTKEVLKCLA